MTRDPENGSIQFRDSGGSENGPSYSRKSERAARGLKMGLSSRGDPAPFYAVEGAPRESESEVKYSRRYCEFFCAGQKSVDRRFMGSLRLS